MSHSSKRELTDGGTDRQTGNRIIIGPSVGRCPLIDITLSFPEFISIHQKQAYSMNFLLSQF